MAIVLALSKADAARSAAQAAPHLERAIRALGRYYILILLAAYFDESGPNTEKLTFSKWLADRAELWALLERALKNPRAAVGVAEAVGGIPFQVYDLPCLI